MTIDRSRLIRMAAALPAGDEQRRAIVSALNKLAGGCGALPEALQKNCEDMKAGKEPGKGKSKSKKKKDDGKMPAELLEKFKAKKKGADTETGKEAAEKQAIKAETSEFIDWVMLNLASEPWSERAMTVYLEKMLGRKPKGYVKTTKRGPDIEVGDMLIPKPDKAPPQNQDVAEKFKYQPMTVDKIDSDGVLLVSERGQKVKFYGKKTGVPTGLYRYTPKSTYEADKTLYEVVYFAKPGEVEQYRKHVVSEYEQRGADRGEDRKRPYYSGYIMGFKESKTGDVYFTIMSQQRPYPVSVNPKKGRLLYLGKMGKRPNWKGDYQKDVAELVEETG